MTAQELRIGNKIMANGLHAGQICTVEQIGAKKSLSENKRVIIFAEHQIGEFVSDCDGIPLTPSILERCGFDFVEEINGWCNKHIIHADSEIGFWLNLFCSNDPDCQIKILYVHQLQNLIYSLDGTELNYKP